MDLLDNLKDIMLNDNNFKKVKIIILKIIFVKKLVII